MKKKLMKCAALLALPTMLASPTTLGEEGSAAITFPDYYDSAGPNCRALADMSVDIAQGAGVAFDNDRYRRGLKGLLRSEEGCTKTVITLSRNRVFELGGRYPADLGFVAKNMLEELADKGLDGEWAMKTSIPLRVGMDDEVAESIEVDVDAVAALRKRLPR